MMDGMNGHEAAHQTAGGTDGEAAPVCLLVGATGGIGSALARRLAAAGWRMVLAARNESRLRELAGEVGGEILALDAVRFDEVDGATTAAVERFGRLDGAVNCVGSILLKPAHLTRAEEWEQTVALNLTSAFALVRGAARAMMDRGGSIVLVSSAAARIGMPNHEAIAAAKAGVAGLAQAAAATYATRKVRVNAVAPGLVRTPLSERITSNPAGEKASLAMHALGRLGEPDDVAAMIHWLLEPQAAWITGQVIGVDGGLAGVRLR
jgi:3-oxoacyl-[acyl-carrier protein] reductase